MRKRSETCFLVAVALISSTLGFSFADAQQKVAREETSGTKDRFTQNFLAQHEIGRRFRIDPAELPPPKASAIVTNRAMTVPYDGQAPQVPPGFTATPFATGLVNPRRLLVLPNGDVLVAEQSAGYLTLLRDDGTGKATWINRHVEDLNKPYGLAWQNDHVLVADQDGIWSVPHVVGALRAGRPENKRADEVPPDERKATPGAYGAKMITKKGVFGIVQGHQNRALVIDPKTGALFVGVGSSGNLGVEPEPKATIQRFNADGSNQTTFASGTRNPTALAFNPQTGDLYALVQERDGLGDLLPSDYLIRVQEGGFYGWPYAYIGKHPQPGFANRAPDKVQATITPDLLFEAHSSVLDLVFYEGDQFPPEFKVTLSWLSKVRGIGQSRPATRSCACHSRTAGLKASMRISRPGFGYPASNAQKYGGAPLHLRLPRMDRCSSLMIPAAHPGVFPTQANVTASLHVRMAQRTVANN